MKKFKSFATFILVLLLTLSFVPSINTQAAEKSIVIDGVTYRPSPGGDSYYATLSNDVKPQPDIHVLDKIDYQGKSYPVGGFSFTVNDYEYIPRHVNYKDKSYSVKAGSWQAVLRKVIFDSGIEDVLWDCVNYPNLEEVSLNVEHSDVNCFYNCPKLKKVSIGKSGVVPLIQRCPNVKITIDPANPYCKTIDNDVYSKNGKTLIQVSSKKANYTVRKGVTYICPEAFMKNDYIKSIVISNTVKNIGINAFVQMSNLTSVKFSHSMKEAPYSAFIDSKKLKKIAYPSNIKKINGNFGGTSRCGLKKIYINAKSLKKSNMKGIPKNCRIYVKNKSVQNRVRKNGFKGRIIIKK